MTFNGWTFLFEAINFLVLALVLNRLLYRPLREAVDRRRETEAGALEAADGARREAETLRQDLKAQLAEIERQRQERIRQAREEGEAERRRLLADGRREVERRQEELRRDLAREREEALNSVRQEVVSQAVGLTRRLLGGASDRSLDEQLAARLAQELERLPEAEQDQLRARWRAGDDCLLESAGEIDASTVNRLTKAVTGIVGERVSASVRQCPELLGGVRLKMAGYVWDGTLAGQLADAELSANGEKRT